MMIISWLASRLPRGSVLVAALAAASCTSARVSPPVTGLRTETSTSAPPPMPVMEQTPVVSAPLPALSASKPGVVDHPERLIKNFNVVDQDLGPTVRLLASQFDMGVQIDPGVHAPVNAKLSGLTLEQALDRLVTQQGYAYQIQDNVIRVTTNRLQTRFFPVEYLSVSRVGTNTTTIPRRIAGGTSGTFGAGGDQGAVNVGGIGGAGSFGGGDAIVAQTVSNLWHEIRVGVEALVFSADPARTGFSPDSGASQVLPPSEPTGDGRTIQSGVYSRLAGDGTRLIVNPMAGQITVTAMPSRLAEVEAYIRSIEASVIRQVLIEARFVEVALSQDRKFGIDWSAVLNRGNSSVTAQSTSGAASGLLEFTLRGGSAQISAVIQALESEGNVQVISKPTVMATNNQPAAFTVTTDEFFVNATRQPILGPNGGTIGFNTVLTQQQVPVGIILHVTPQISADNVTMMLIRPVVTTVARVQVFQLDDGTRSEMPIVDRRDTDTMVRLRDGETIIIGGLTQVKETRDRSGVPGLRSVPVLGRLFTRYQDVQRRSELVIFLTPHVVAGNPLGAR